MKRKGWLAVGILTAVLSFSMAGGAETLTLPEAGLRLNVPRDWQVMTAATADEHTQALAAMGTSPDVVRADMEASGALALMYAPDMEARLVCLGEAEAESVWTADEAAKAALALQAQAAYPGLEAAWLNESWLTLEGQESWGGMTVYRGVWVTCQYGELYALEASRYGQPFTETQQAELTELASSALVLGKREAAQIAQSVVYPALEIPTAAGSAEVSVLRDEIAITLDNACTHLYWDGYVLTGKTDPNTDLRYYVNGAGVERLVSDENGVFATDVKLLKKGKNTVRVQAVSDKGYGTVSFPLIYSPEKTPVATAELPAKVAGESFVLVGRTVPGATATVYIGKEPFRAEMNEDGTFTVDVTLDKIKKYNLTLRVEHEHYNRHDVKFSLTRVKTPEEEAKDRLKKAKTYDYAKMLENPAYYEKKLTAPQGRITALENSAAAGPMIRFEDEAGQVYRLRCEHLLAYTEGLTGQALVTLAGELSADGLPMGEMICFFPSAD